MRRSSTVVAAEKFYGNRLRKHAHGGATSKQLAHGAASFFTVVEGPAIHVHANEFVGQHRVHVARKLQSIIQRGLAMFERVGNAFAYDASDLAAQRRA